MTFSTAEQHKENCIAMMGEDLGKQYAELWQEVVYLHRKWREYVVLFGTKPQRIDLLNKAAPNFFRMINDVLFDEIILHITRLTDPPKSLKKHQNLTIRNFPLLVSDCNARDSLQNLISEVDLQSKVFRDWRDKRGAHLDLPTALGEAPALDRGSRAQIGNLINIIAETMNIVDRHCCKSETAFHMERLRGGAIDLIYVLDDGIKAAEAREARFKAGTPLDDDLAPRDL